MGYVKPGVHAQWFSANEMRNATGFGWCIHACVSPYGVELIIWRWQLDIIWRRLDDTEGGTR